jgi:polygalacturonase
VRLTEDPFVAQQAFNTDGFDVSGRNVYGHDLYIWNQDDCISVKDGSQDMVSGPA